MTPQTPQTEHKAVWLRILRISLLVLNVLAMILANLFGVGLFFIANIFCDSGPPARCFHMGLQFLGTGVLTIVCVFPAVLALTAVGSRFSWYLKVYPSLLLLMIVVAMRWHSDFSVESTGIAIMYGVMAVLTCIYVFLSRSSKVKPGA